MHYLSEYVTIYWKCEAENVQPSRLDDSAKKVIKHIENVLLEREMEYMENSAVVNRTGPLCPVDSAIRVPPLGYRMVKRAFDLTAALILSVLLAVPAAILMLLIRLDSPGPAIFRQERLGKNGKPFMILKLRSMRLDAEKNGPRWAERNDSRCTRLGSFLRRSRLDELPQLWNILHGEMSFVGPRPERAYFYDQFEKTIPGFRNRLAVIPGLTGLAQVNGGYDLSPDQKIVFDMKYIENCCVGMDLSCMLKTVRLVFTHEGAR